MKHTLYIIPILLLTISSSVSGQNDFYDFYNNKVWPYLKDSHEEAIETFLNYEDSASIDPYYYSMAIYYSYENDDIENAKRLLHRMIKDGGFNADPYMFKLSGEKFPYYEIDRLKLREYCIDLYHKYHTDYLKSHPQYLAWSRLENKYRATSRVMTAMRSIYSDSTNNNCREIALERMSDMSIDLFDNIELFCKLTDNFPNSFDHGLYTSARFGAMLLAYAQTPENLIKVRDLILKYGLEHYRKGKFNSDIFYSIDTWQNELAGTQFFGYLEGVYIVKDEKTGLHQGPYFNEIMERQ